MEIVGVGPTPRVCTPEFIRVGDAVRDLSTTDVATTRTSTGSTCSFA
jgi:hypothetical protein